MKRLCLFVGYDCKNEIDDYVVYYVKKMSELAEVYYYGDFNCKPNELKKLEPYCKKAFAKRHKKYDFGSWQELIKIIGKDEIRKYDQLILANDSCYGPIYDLKNVFKKMDQKKCDFWGLSASKWYHIHIQSYFIVLNNNVLQYDTLFNFFEKVEEQPSLNEVCEKYEDRFTYVLSKAGFSFDSYVPYGDYDNQPYYNVSNSIINANFPLVKVKTFYGEVGKEPIKDWKKLIIQNTDYDISLIEKNLAKRGLTEKEIYYNLYSKKKVKLHKIIIRKIKKLIKTIIYPFYKIIKRFLDRKFEYLENIYNYKFSMIEKELYKLKCRIISLENVNDRKITKKIEFKNYFEDKDTIIFNNISKLFYEFKFTDRDILFVGNTNLANSLEFSSMNNNIYLLNDKNEINVANRFINQIYTKDLSSFKIDNLYFDLIIINSFKEDTPLDDVCSIVNNLFNFLVKEGTLVLNISNKMFERYLKKLEKVNIILDVDAYGEFMDIITNNGNYKTFFLKRKKRNI